MKKRGGLFLVLEGLDGAGTTTQAARIHRDLSERGLPIHLTREPTDAPIGKLIRDAISGRLVAPAGEPLVLSEAALCLLFAADRIEHSGRIERLRAEATHVISDRYLLSSIAYQSLDPAISAERVVQANLGCAIPDVTFLLKVPVETCLRRLERRNDSPTVYEKRELLTRIDHNYEMTAKLYESHFGPLILIDGTQTVETVHADIIKGLSPYLPA